jgi:hypothetical protein
MEINVRKVASLIEGRRADDGLRVWKGRPGYHSTAIAVEPRSNLRKRLALAMIIQQLNELNLTRVATCGERPLSKARRCAALALSISNGLPSVS